MSDCNETEKHLEILKLKSLEAARGKGTSMISLIMPPGQQLCRVTNMLSDEHGTASNIKKRANRQSVVPPNGLVLYTGTIMTDDGKEKKVTIDFEPFKPINASLYLCENVWQPVDRFEWNS